MTSGGTAKTSTFLSYHCSKMQRCVTIHIACVDREAIGQEKLDRLRIACLCRQVEKSIPTFIADINLRTRVLKQLQDCGLVMMLELLWQRCARCTKNWRRK